MWRRDCWRCALETRCSDPAASPRPVSTCTGCHNAPEGSSERCHWHAAPGNTRSLPQSVGTLGGTVPPSLCRLFCQSHRAASHFVGPSPQTWAGPSPSHRHVDLELHPPTVAGHSAAAAELQPCRQRMAERNEVPRDVLSA